MVFSRSLPLIYAHRGGAGLYPESTLFAYEHVIQMGVDVIDMDICLSQEDELIVSHTPYLHPELTRDVQGHYLSSSKLLIKELTLEQVKSYNVGKIKPGSSLEKEYPSQASLEHAPIPTLKEVIHLAKTLSHHTMRYQIEIKYDVSCLHLFASMKKLMHTLLNLLHEENILHLTEVQCFDWDVLIQLQLLQPDLQTAYLSPSYNYHYTLSLPQTIVHLGGAIWGPEYTSLSQEDLLEAKHLGLRVVPWTVNDPKEMKKLLKAGVDGIITDRPDLLKEVLLSS
jgi:glycerophosphoryl diester phosphodiesterase